LWSLESEAFEGFEDQDALEFEQPSLVEGKSSLMHADLSYITSFNSLYLFFLLALTLTGTY
jgi:hypothetical protein